MNDDDAQKSPQESPADGSSVRQVGKESLLYLPGKLTFAVMAVVAVPIYTHFFSVADLGRFDLALKFSLFLWTLCIMWLSNVILRFYPPFHQRGEEDLFLGVIGLLRSVGFIVGVVLCAAVWLAAPDNLVGSYRSLLGLAALAFIGRSCLEMGLVLLTAKRKPIAYSVASTVNAIAKLALGILIAVPLKAGVAGLLWSAALVPMTVYLIGMHRHFGRVPLRLDRAERQFLKEALFYGLPIMMNLVLNFFLANTDRYLLNYIRGEAEVGIFSIGHFLADQPIQLIYTTLMLAAFPAAMHMYEASGRRATERLVSSLARVYLLAVVPACAVVAVLARPILFSLAHGEARQSYVVVPWVASGALILGLMQYYTIGLYLAKRTFLLFTATTVATAVNVLCNWVLIPQEGYYGCGVARVISNTALLVLMAAASYKYLHWRFPWVPCLRIAVAAAAAGAATYFLKGLLPTNIFSLAALFTIGGLVYGVAAFALGEISREEIGHFLAHVRKG